MGKEEARSQADGYRPIKEYGIIGNMLTAALVSIEGSMDWCCRNGLLRRFTPDSGRKGEEEGAFLWCSFWLVRNYVRMGRVDDAVALYEKLLCHGNHLGLFSEMIDPESGEAMGNFPQALTHLAIIVTGLELSDAVQNQEKERTKKQRAA